MTKDEAIDREAEWKLFKAQMMLDYGSHVFKRDALGESDNMAWQDAFGGWLAAKRSIAQPTSEAVAEKPQDDHNAASPAAPAFQDGAAASDAKKLHAMLAEFDLYEADSLAQMFGVSFKEWRKRYVVQPEQSSMAGAAKGGITMNALREWENMPWAKPAAAQPAADPAPVPAQGIDHAKHSLTSNTVDAQKSAIVDDKIDHAKLAEGEAEVLRDLHAAAMREPVGETFGAIMAAIQHLEWLGQQAGVPEGWADDLRAIDKAMQHMGDALNEIDAVEESDEDIAAPGFEAIARLLAAVPGEAG